MSFQIFLPSYFGTRLHRQSEFLTYEAFKSDWIKRDRQLLKMLMILVERTMRPINIKAAGVFELGLSTFLKVNSNR